MVNKSHNDSLAILAQIVQTKAKRQNELDFQLGHWARPNIQELSVLMGNTMLAKGEVPLLRDNLQ